MASTGEVWKLGHRPALDGVRGIAVLLVLIGHAFAESGFSPLAAAGVTIFFALSGYLITGALMAERGRSGTVQLGRFYWRRTTRLVPPLVAMVAVMSLVMRPGWSAVLPAVTWTMNYATLANLDVSPFGHAWSLAVEEQFYLLWPLALAWLMRHRSPVSALAAIIAVLLVWRLCLTFVGEWRYAYHATETAGVGLLVGCLVAMVGWRLRGRDATAALALILVLSVAASVAAGALLWLVIPLAVMPLSAVVLAGASEVGWLRAPVLRWFGAASYSLYLWHLPVSHALTQSLTPFGVAVGALVGAAAWWLLERPLMAWRERAHRREGASPNLGPANRKSEVAPGVTEGSPSR